jgi:hypothetical protein
MLLVLAVALLTAAGSRADARSVTVTGTKCIYDFVPYEGDSVSGNFVLAHHDTFRSSDHPGIDLTVLSYFIFLGHQTPNPHLYIPKKLVRF